MIDPSLSAVSGVGLYKGTFAVKNGWEDGGSAYLDLGMLDDYFTVTVNGIRLPPLDQTQTVVDLGPYVRSGSNTIAVEVATTLHNRAVEPGKRYGISGTVQLIPYRFQLVDMR
jgi:hypothetical protein